MNEIDVMVVMLPTPYNNLPKFFILNNKIRLLKGQKFGIHENEEYQHLYFTSNEEIKEHDTIICIVDGVNQGKIVQNLTSHGALVYTKVAFWVKIVASTDSSLGLPEIQQSFLEEYVKSNGSIKSVKLQTYTQKYRNWVDTTHLSLTEANEVIVLPEPERGIVITKDSVTAQALKTVPDFGKKKVVDEVEEAAKKYGNDVIAPFRKELDSFADQLSEMLAIAVKAGVQWAKEQSANETIEFAEWLQEGKWPADTDSYKKLYDIWQSNKSQ